MKPMIFAPIAPRWPSHLPRQEMCAGLKVKVGRHPGGILEMALGACSLSGSASRSRCKPVAHDVGQEFSARIGSRRQQRLGGSRRDSAPATAASANVLCSGSLPSHPLLLRSDSFQFGRGVRTNDAAMVRTSEIHQVARPDIVWCDPRRAVSLKTRLSRKSNISRRRRDGPPADAPSSGTMTKAAARTTRRCSTAEH